jgi:hypothetical protein
MAAGTRILALYIGESMGPNWPGRLAADVRGRMMGEEFTGSPA